MQHHRAISCVVAEAYTREKRKRPAPVELSHTHTKRLSQTSGRSRRTAAAATSFAKRDRHANNYLRPTRCGHSSQCGFRRQSLWGELVVARFTLDTGEMAHVTAQSAAHPRVPAPAHARDQRRD